MTTLDVEILFSNISLHETINICLNYLFPLPHSLVLRLNRKYLRTLLEHTALYSFFISSNKLYKQFEEYKLKYGEIDAGIKEKYSLEKKRS